MGSINWNEVNDESCKLRKITNALKQGGYEFSLKLEMSGQRRTSWKGKILSYKTTKPQNAIE